jgi:ATP-dependent Lon protease
MNAPNDKQPLVRSAPRGQELPEDVLLVVPVRNLVVFPGAVTQVSLGREVSIAAVREAVQGSHRLGIVLQRDATVDEPSPSDLFRVGTIVKIIRYVSAPNGVHQLVCQGEQRFRAIDFLPGLPFLAARFDAITQQESDRPEIEGRAEMLKQQTAKVMELLPQASPELLAALQAMKSAGQLADMITGFMDFKPEDKQAVLEAFDVQTRLDKVIELLTHRLQVLQISREIGAQTKETIDEHQRKYFLRKQLETIKKELGEDESNPEFEELSRAIQEAKMPQEADEQAHKELKRLREMPEASGEYSMVRTYLDWLVSLPWSILDEEMIDIARAREILDREHFGLDKIKRRILEYLAVRKLNPAGRSPILCFVGPPGVGKTSLGQSIAHALGLKFVRASLGGVHDEAEIRGHRRTYIGAMPGRIIQSIRKAGARNPVFMLDEMDKLGVGFQGDPSSALLEVLDPEQNSTFRDNYLGVNFDLSKVFFIGTANVLDGIPGALRDRMEVIELPGYTHDEKMQIGKRFLIARQLEANGLQEGQATISEEALAELIDAYTREAGVRNLEREIGAVLRHAAMRIAEGKAEHVDVGLGDLAPIRGARKFEREVMMRTNTPGVATGLAWTPMGGDILFVEASAVPGKGKLILTGHLGDVMKESAQAAVSLVKGRAEQLGIERSTFEQNDLHVHVPAGAIPKDGPSAGVAMFISVYSLLSKRKVRSDVAMTGEISLRGQVLPVGGIKEKALAALRAGIKTVLLPARNRKDLEDIPPSASEQLEFVWLERVEDAVAAALDPTGAAATG